MKRSATVSILGLILGATCGVGLATRQQRSRYSFRDRCVVITGGSRGLGLVLARQLARQGARLALLALNAGELSRAEEQLNRLGAEVLSLPCDVTQQEQVQAAIEKVIARFGQVDVLINNAGIIQVGPLEHMTVKDFEAALDIHLFGPLYCTLAVLPHMRRAGQGRIVNISSIGGKIAVPHLLPYSVSKFALVGLSDGLRAELRRENIFVTTICPGLMRTGSPRNALFKGSHRREYAWFALGASLPFLSMDAERAGEQILEACRRGLARRVLGIHMKGAVLLNELAPGAMGSLLALANRLLPGPAGEVPGPTRAGFESQSALAPSWLTRLSQRAALRNNEAG
jgi:NAD(P)-dependent dehydrogenase (short-subunit alcohol dehydrogenase family)